MIDNNTKKGAGLNVLLAFILTAVFFAAVILLYDFTYGVIDDPFIATVLNGAYTGTPDAHVVYMKYPLAWILVLLFRWISSVNWHFFLLVGCFVICIFVVNFRIASNVKKILYKVIFMILFMLLFWLCMAKMVLTAHYSMCAAVLAATGIFYFATIKYKSSKLNIVLNYLAAFLMLWTAYAIRARTLFMLLPLAAAVFIYKFFHDKPAFNKANVIRMIIFPIILFIGLGGMELMHNAQYKSKEWQTFLAFNDARTTLYDFYGLPEYEGNEEFYESLNISGERQYMYEKYYLEFQDGVPDDALTQIADYRVSEYAEKMPTGERIKETIKALPVNLTLKTYAPVNWISAASFIIILLIALIMKKWRVAIAIILGVITSLIPWLWMIYMGKPTSRVTMGIWAADLLFAAALLIDNSEDIGNYLKRKAEKLSHGLRSGIAVLLAVLVAAALTAGIAGSYKKVHKTVDSSLASGNVRSALEEWCEKSPDKLYICESEIVNGLGFNVRKVDNKLQNLYWPGGWTAKMAQSKEIWNRFAVEDIEKGIIENKNVYLIAFRDTDVSYWLRFYRENYPAASLETVQEIELEETPFTIYQLQER